MNKIYLLAPIPILDEWDSNVTAVDRWYQGSRLGTLSLEDLDGLHQLEDTRRSDDLVMNRRLHNAPR